MWFLIIAGYLSLFVVALVLAVKFAPLGYEDESGFHGNNSGNVN